MIEHRYLNVGDKIKRPINTGDNDVFEITAIDGEREQWKNLTKNYIVSVWWRRMKCHLENKGDYFQIIIPKENVSWWDKVMQFIKRSIDRAIKSNEEVGK